MQVISNKRRHRYGVLQWLVLAGAFFVGGAARCPAIDQPLSDGTPPPTKAEPNQIGQTRDAQAAAVGLSTYMDNVRQGNVHDSELYPLTARYGTALLPHLRTYARDPDPEVAYQVSSFMFFLLRDARDPMKRSKVVDCLAEMLKESYETGRSLDMGRPLLAFSRASDFSPVAKHVLHNLLSRVTDGTYKNPYQIEQIILLVGIADMQSELPRLQELIDRWDLVSRQRHQRRIDRWQQNADRYGKVIPKSVQNDGESLRKKAYWQHSVLWDALRARARMGVKEDIRHCIEMAESHPDPDYRSNYLFGQLAYIRQPEVIEYLAPYLDSDKKPPSGGPDTIVRSYAASAASAIAGMLENAPIKSYQTLPKDILLLRKWMAEQTEWKIVR